MITPAFGLTATERVLPRLALDFTTASLDSRITFTRSGATATRVNASGYIETLAADTARFDFNPITLACRGLLIEAGRANLALYSEDCRNTTDAGSSRPWQYSAGVTVTPDNTAAPDNTTTADLIVSGDEAGLYQTVSVTSGVAYTQSTFLKYKSGTALYRMRDDVTGISAIFNISTGAVVSASAGVTAQIEPYANGFYRVSATYTTSAVTARVWMRPNGGSGEYWQWGSGMELGDSLTSYIATSGSTVTRNADFPLMDGTNFSDWFNAIEGTFGIQLSTPINYSSGFNSFLVASDGTSANRISISSNSGADVVNTEVSVSSSTVAGFYPAYTTGSTKMFLAYKENNVNYGKDGTSGTTDTSCAVPTLSRLSIGTAGAGANPLNGHVQKVWYFPQRLTNAELAAFSK